MIYSLEEVRKKCLEYFNEDELACDVFINKYAVKDKDGNLLESSPTDMHWRMAREFTKIENKYYSAKFDPAKLSEFGQKRFQNNKRTLSLSADEVFQYFDRFNYIVPQGSVMAILGNPNVFGSLSNCVVVDSPFDSYSGIFYSDQQLAQLFKRRCGVGIDISSLRPLGTSVSNAAGSSTGAVSFMERFSNTTREVAQNGRRGALMITMDIKHPDAEQFALMKQDLQKVTGANISLRISDEFMKTVEQDIEFVQQWPIDSKNPKIVKKVRAKDLWNVIVKCAHNTAEPGLIFWDHQHKYSPASIYPHWQNISTNPCGEIGMSGYDSCRLMALNLFKCVNDPFTANAKFNYDKWFEVVYNAQRLMDDLVDLEIESIDRILEKIDQDPEPEHIKNIERDLWVRLRNNGRDGRRTGLGFTGLADALAALGIKFDSDIALKTVDFIMQTKCIAEFESSIDMAIERGSFVGYDPKIERQSEFIQMLEQQVPLLVERMKIHGRRNISISTVAPNGSLSLLTQTSSGIEPVYMLSYKRRRKVHEGAKIDFIDALGDKWQEYEVLHPKLDDWKKISGNSDASKNPYAGSSAEEIDWLTRIDMQAIVQKWTTHSISSTINLPESIAPEKVGEIYMYAWKQGLKGITVYRSGARSGVLTALEEQKKKLFEEHHAPKRPKLIDADLLRFTNGGEKWIAFVGLIDGHPYEIFTGKQDKLAVPGHVEYGAIRKTKIDGKSRYDFVYKDKEGEKQVESLNEMFNQEYWTSAKLISAVLRHGMPLPSLVKTLESLTFSGDENIGSWKTGVVRSLKKYIKDGTAVSDTYCPNCKDPSGLIYKEGCVLCKNCGFSKC